MRRSGLLVLNKPAGISSRDCVDKVIRAAGDKRLKAGHAGTLDPMATGVLIVAIGESTRIVEQLHELDKRYVADFEFGKSSDTLDSDGTVSMAPSSSTPEHDQLQATLNRFIGPAIMQRPPRVSAIKIGGRRAYDLARSGAEFEPESRPVSIHAISLLQYQFPCWRIELHCGSGTYVRSLGRDIAESLGNSAIMTRLVRTAIGPFTLERAVAVDRVVTRDDIEQHLRNPLEGLTNWRKIRLNEFQCEAVRHGRAVRLMSDQWQEPSSHAQAAAVDAAGQLIALLDIVSGGHARPTRVFQGTW